MPEFYAAGAKTSKYLSPEVVAIAEQLVIVVKICQSDHDVTKEITKSLLAIPDACTKACTCFPALGACCIYLL